MGTRSSRCTSGRRPRDRGTGPPKPSRRRWHAMRQVLAEYYPLAESEEDALWRGAMIVVDTNVLLSLHRFTKSTRDELMRLLQAIAADDRLWAPHQVAEEYH